MRKKYFAPVAVIALLLASPASAETITLVADEWCPYNCGERGEKPGYMVEIAREAMKPFGVDVTYKVMPWAKAIELTRDGKYEAVVGANRGDAPDFIFPGTVQGISINQAWVSKESTWKYQGISSLDGRRIGVIAGYSYGKNVDPYLRKRGMNSDGTIRIVSTDNATAANIDALLAGNIDVILEDKNVVEYYFASRDMPMLLKPVGNPVAIENVDDTYIFVAFGPNNPKAKKYARMLTEGVRSLRQNGQLKQILSRYNMDDSYRFLGKAKGPERHQP